MQEGQHEEMPPEGQQDFLAPGAMRKRTIISTISSSKPFKMRCISVFIHTTPTANLLNPHVWPLSDVSSEEIWFIITQCQSWQNHG